MVTRRSRTARSLLVPLVALATLAVSVLVAVPGGAEETASPVTFELGDLDTRGIVQPNATQLSLASGLGASVTWNRFGTPSTLFKPGGTLGSGTGSAEAVARAWMQSNRDLFRLTSAEVSNLEVLSDTTLTGNPTHVVLLRQRFGSLVPTEDGIVTVAVKDGQVLFVSSSIAPAQGTPAAATLSPTEAWVEAARSLGRNVTVGGLGATSVVDEWTAFSVPGFAQEQRVRPVAVPTPNGVRPAFEANVVDVEAGESLAYTVFVDAVTGGVLVRRNQEDHLLAAPSTSYFTGSYGATAACGPYHGPYTAPIGTKSIDVTATGAVANDIILELHFGQGNPVAFSDIPAGPNPEEIHYAPEVVPPGDYFVRVCPFEAGQPPPQTYVGTITINDVVAAEVPYPPKWNAFPASPPLDLSNTDIRELWCWVSQVDGSPIPGCQREVGNDASRAPWDWDLRTGQPTFTTKGNNAVSGEAWMSPLTPAEQYRPVSPTREYVFPWTDQWEDSNCSPTSFASPQRVDIDPAVANLFAMHNRMHDWSYYLGFTEVHYNMQESNFGLTSPGPFPGGRENDPEIGNAQAGAIDGGAPSYLGRDNANQITLQDGVPGITNMYLWQPIAAAFYPPCVDGDYDMSVIGHEYTHAISNRMIGGPDAGITSSQGRAMGESWSDLSAVEYLNEYGLVPIDGESPFAVGPYVTGDKQTGIRNYNMSDSPLNFSNMGYDMVCDTALVGPPVEPPCDGPIQPHADGEIWSAINHDIRQALVSKYNGSFPATNAALQEDCADGEVAPQNCPGNRRWVQIMFDAFLLMPADVGFIGARDAYLAADVARFGGANQATLWDVFARRGLGQFASSGMADDPATEADESLASGEDPQPRPSFESPLRTDEATVTFVVNAAEEGGAAVKAQVFVGRYEARVTPIADTDGATPLGATAKFVPGTYEFLVRADGYGTFRFTRALSASQASTLTIALPTNKASKTKGAVATGEGVHHDHLIDDTEGTTWAVLGRTPDVTGAKITVDLAGGTQTVKRVQVSALLRPVDPDDPQDSDFQNRFSALRQFEIWTCRTTASVTCTTDAQFTKIYTSSAAAFPAAEPRPTAPDLLLREFDVPDTAATHVRLVVVENQCTGGPRYQGDQDADPANDSDCSSGSEQDTNVRAAELQVFTGAGSVSASGGGGGGGGGTLGFTGHGHSDLNGNGQAGEQDVHVFAGTTGAHGTTGSVAGYWDMRGNPPGAPTSNFRCTGTPTSSTKNGSTVTITGTVRCSGFSPAKTFTLTITDGGANPPNSDGYRMVLRNKKNVVVYDFTGTTTVGMGDLVVT